MKIAFIADFFLEDILGGGEICNECVIKHLEKKHQIVKLKSDKINLEIISNYKDYFFIVGNFVFLKNDVYNFILNNCKYIIYEHDYKFLKNRNPAKFVNFIAPNKEIIFYDFYKNAKKIICQTEFQKIILQKNLNLNNIVSLGTNFWLETHYNLLEEYSNICKNNKYAIVDYQIDHKNTIGAIEYSKKNNLDFELIKDKNYESFLKKLGVNKGFIFLPKTPETFSRTVLEARMMNLETKINNLIGCSKEEWFVHYKGLDLINFTKEKNKQAFKFIEELI